MSQTITGCVNLITGRVVFDDIGCVTGQTTGCIEWTGEHAGQVKFTITAATQSHCEDTYYGCVNWGTGRFQVIIPDNCCCPYPTSTDTCCADCTPLKVTATFSSVTECTACTGNGLMLSLNTALNGSHTLNQSSGDDCIFEKVLTDGAHKILYENSDCTGGETESDIDYYIYVTITGATARVSVEGAGRWFYNTSIAITGSDCIEFSGASNTNPSCSMGMFNATGGTVSVIEADRY